jgi:hypothetical protein
MPLCLYFEYYNQRLLFLLSQKMSQRSVCRQSFKQIHTACSFLEHPDRPNTTVGSWSSVSFPPPPPFLCVRWFLAPCTVHVLPRVNCVELKFAHESSIGIFLHGKTLDSINRSHIRNGVQVTCRHALPTADHAEQPSRFVRVKGNHVLRTHQTLSC